MIDPPPEVKRKPYAATIVFVVRSLPGAFCKETKATVSIAEPHFQIAREMLPAIPVHDVGADFGFATVVMEPVRVNQLLAEAAHGLPRGGLVLADKISRAWLAGNAHPYLGEIDRIARQIRRPGGHFFNVHYEWGCTTGVKTSPDGRSARLLRVLDWRTKGLGRNIIAARIACPLGRYTALTWPGFTGVLQAVAPGRFAAALNQAPMAIPVGLMPVDWALNRFKVWRRPHLTPAHLLRQVFERARTFTEARAMLIETPLSVPTIYTLAGLEPGEGAVIERLEEEANVLPGEACAVNAWSKPEWRGRARGPDNPGRRNAMAGLDADATFDLAWLRPPVLNYTTRLAMMADAKTGELIAQGYEADGPATTELRLAG